MVPVDDGASPAPIGRAVLEQLRSRFAGSRMFESAEIIEEGKLYLCVDLADTYYPGSVSARLEIRWYRNDDFNFQALLKPSVDDKSGVRDTGHVSCTPVLAALEDFSRATSTY